MLDLWPVGPFQTKLSQCFDVAGKGAVARRSTGPRAGILSGLRKVTAVPRDAPLWVALEIKVDRVPALIDTGAQFSCIRSDVAQFLYRMGVCFHVMCGDVLFS